jgi:DNA-binding PadR family transcriptional regulator
MVFGPLPLAGLAGGSRTGPTSAWKRACLSGSPRAPACLPRIVRWSEYVAAVSIREIRDPSFLVLAALAGGPRHGYALMQCIEREVDEKGVIKPGTLYAALDRLTKEGLVIKVSEEIVEGRSRRYYDLTDRGTTALSAEVEKLERRSAFANGQLRIRRALA